MKKSIYSLVLSDAVIEGIDRMAYSMGISRSALINNILAEKVCYVTPEQRMAEIFNTLETLIRSAGEYRITSQPSVSMFSLTAPIAYKYNPTLKYTLELYKEPSTGGESGVLRISLRSKSTALIECLGAFYLIWSTLEKRTCGRCGTISQDGRYSKPLYISGNLSAEEFGTAIADYITAIDGAMRRFFNSLEIPTRAAREVELCYLSYINSKKNVL
ncbi:MAG: hypothetical protein IIW21_02365 [Clostridia bacterium]|nr:hypothetical protein [Clostridia bacterium]MBR0326197.1 hypothetical protein [Clostridia bacterium]